jgi:RimJ/RimL family protein N-acetyltransferase
MEVCVLEDPDAFTTLAAPVLTAEPVTNTVVATVAEMHRSRDDAPPAWWFVVLDGGEPVGVAMLVPPWPVYLGPLPVDAPALVIDAIADLGAPVKGFSGEQESVREAVTWWQRLNPAVGVAASRGMRLYRLEHLQAPHVAGAARAATTDDTDLLVLWYWAFHQEISSGGHEVEQTVRYRLEGHGGFVLWEDGGHPVALAGFTPTVAGVARIGPVYTPPEHRGHGYGAAVTAAASRAAMTADTQAVVLFSDLGNPTSNRVYTKIGYCPVRDYLEVRLHV